MANQTGIRTFLDKLKRQLKVYQQALLVTPRNKQPVQGQLNTEEFVEQDAGLLLAVGNELLITDKIVKMYRGLSNALGRVVIIDEISTKNDAVIKASAFGIQVTVDMKIAQHMRGAYLRREQTSSST